MYRFLDGDGLSVLLYNRFYSNGFCSYGLSCSGRFSDWGWNRLFFLRVSLSPRLGLFLGCFFGGKGKFKGAIVEFDDVAGADKPVEVGCERLFKFLEVGLGFAGFEEVIKEIRPCAAGGGFDDVEDAGDVVGDAPGFGAEPNRTHDGDVEDAFAVFPNVEAGILEVGADLVDGLGREGAFFFPSVANAVANLPVIDVATGDTAHFQGFSGAQTGCEVVLPEVSFDVLKCFEFERFGFLRGAPEGDAADLFFPLFDDGGVADDFDLPEEFVEVHAAAEAGFEEAPQGGLVAVVAGGSEEDAAQTAAGHIDIVAFWGFDLLGFLDEIFGFIFAEGFTFCSLAVGGDGAVFADLVEWVGGGVGRDAHAMALGFVEEHPAQPVEGVGAMARLDLLGEGGDAVGLR